MAEYGCKVTKNPALFSKEREVFFMPDLNHNVSDTSCAERAVAGDNLQKAVRVNHYRVHHSLIIRCAEMRALTFASAKVLSFMPDKRISFLTFV